MFELILKGVVTGLILSVMLGPAFFVLLETSIRKGIRSALAFDAGVLISDIVYIIIAYVFIQQVEELSRGTDNAVIRAVGGGMFLIFGLFTFFKTVSTTQLDPVRGKAKNSRDFWILFIKGLILNLANPLVIFYWFSVMALGKSGQETVFTGWDMFLYLTVILVTFFSIDVLKIMGAKKLRPFITSALLRSLNRIVGSILVAFGVFLIINSIVLWLK
ncbi:MAG: LysE family transporter [Brumimicrobium sp.]|nr:LysE family transporter [Brumimicrobium sp.]